MLRGGVVLVTAIAVVFAIRLSGGVGEEPPARPTQSGTTWSRLQVNDRTAAQRSAADATVRARFALWRGRPEAMPRRLEDKVMESLGAPRGTRFTETQRVRTPQGAVWAVKAGAVRCVIQASRGAVLCAPPNEVSRRGLMLGVYTLAHGTPTHFVALGVAPDGTGHARLDVGGTLHRVPVRRNAYALEAARPILSAGLER
jgi:hypothetical protein